MEFKLTNEEQILLFAAHPNLNELELKKLANLILKISDWDDFSKRIYRSGLSSLIYKNFNQLSNKSSIPETVSGNLKKRYITLFFNNAQKHKDLEKVIKLCNKNNIPIIPLKGIPLIHFIYKDFGLRSMSDIDILVKDNDIEKFKEILLDNGWELDNSQEISPFVTQMADSQHPYTFTLGSTKIELHNKLHSGLSSYQINLEKYWLHADEIDLLDGKVYHFSATDFLQHLCFHLHKHLINEHNVAMKHFIDIAAFIKKYETEINWENLISSSKQYNCEVEIRDTLELCRDYFETTIPDDIFQLLIGPSEFDPHFLFVHYLRNDKKAIEEYVLTKHDKYKETFSKINGTQNKLKYLFELFIPTKKFMINRYEIQNKNFVYFYYLKRIWVGIVKGIESKK